MEKNANDKLIWVDLFDNEIGSGEKLETHVKNQLLFQVKQMKNQKK